MSVLKMFWFGKRDRDMILVLLEVQIYKSGNTFSALITPFMFISWVLKRLCQGKPIIFTTGPLEWAATAQLSGWKLHEQAT